MEPSLVDPAIVDMVLNSVVTLIVGLFFYGANVVGLAGIQVSRHKASSDEPIPYPKIILISLVGAVVAVVIELMALAIVLGVIGTILGLVLFGLLLAICGGN